MLKGLVKKIKSNRAEKSEKTRNFACVIHCVSGERILEMLKNPEAARRELYIARNAGLYIAIDNSTGEMWQEEFLTFEEAKKWLRRSN